MRKQASYLKMNYTVKIVVPKGMESEMTWEDLTNALNNLTDDVSYLAVDDDGYITLRIGKISNDSPIPEAILEEILGI
tara:strand:+ start:68 stop:301 length:234 start_codon:yes stop_codon:yes gene_type:complete